MLIKHCQNDETLIRRKHAVCIHASQAVDGDSLAGHANGTTCSPVVSRKPTSLANIIIGCLLLLAGAAYLLA